LRGDQAKAQSAKISAEQKLRVAFQKAEEKAQAAGGSRPTGGDADGTIKAVNTTVTSFVAQAAETRFVDLQDGTILDRKFDLQWEKKAGPIDFTSDYVNPHDVDNQYTWGSAVAPYPGDGTAFTDFLAKLNGGAGPCLALECDWRLPSFKELQSLALAVYPAACPSNPCIDPIFDPIPNGSYWSVTTDANNASKAHAFEFLGGYGLDTSPKNNAYYVRGVRSVQFGIAETSAPPLAQCGVANKCVFLTSAISTGNLGGLAGADATCNVLAGAAGLPGTYVAWLSDSTTDAITRVTSNGPYVTPVGATVANTLADLADGSLNAPIDHDENGVVVPLREAWTGTSSSGLRDSSTCADWTADTAATLAIVGHNTSTSDTWTNWSCPGRVDT
jgi:hypothetical protein